MKKTEPCKAIEEALVYCITTFVGNTYSYQMFF